MISKAEAKELIRDLFEEEALIIGGLVATHNVADEVIWELMRGLDTVRRKFFTRIGQVEDEDSDSVVAANLEPHPAIEEFLLRLKKDR